MTVTALNAVRSLPARTALRRAGWSWLWMVCAWGAANGQAAEPSPLPTANRLDPVAVIKRIQEAANRHSFTGTFVVSAGAAITSLRITHVTDGHNQVDRIDTLDGPLREIYRHNDLVHVLWPQSHSASIEHRDLGLDYPTALQTDAAARLDMYELQPAGIDRVAGMEADVVQVRPRDTHRYGQRLWLERRSGLLLRTDILGERGELIESSGFSELHWDTRLPPQAVLAQMHQLKGYRVERSQLVHTDLESEGWMLRAPLFGFRLVKAYRHRSGLASAAESASDPARAAASIELTGRGSRVVQAVLGDGLTTVSLFIERFDPDRHQHEASAANHGATHALARRQGEWWITAVGDVPLETLQQFAGQLERRKP